jgi:hypothetical protein
VFVGCSYSPWPIGGYRDAFREVAKIQNTLTFEFADVRIEDTWILDKVRRHIERCDVGLFDLTYLNPNVLLELGIALGMKKRTHIFINAAADERSGFFSRIFSSKRPDLPVNLQGLELVQYSTKSELVRKLLKLCESLGNSIDSRTFNHSYRVRQAIMQILQQDSGLRITEIESKSGETIEFVRSALQRLRREGLIRTEGRASGTRYYAVTPPPRETEGTSGPEHRPIP